MSGKRRGAKQKRLGPLEKAAKAANQRLGARNPKSSENTTWAATNETDLTVTGKLLGGEKQRFAGAERSPAASVTPE